MSNCLADYISLLQKYLPDSLSGVWQAYLGLVVHRARNKIGTPSGGSRNVIGGRGGDKSEPVSFATFSKVTSHHWYKIM